MKKTDATLGERLEALKLALKWTVQSSWTLSAGILAVSVFGGLLTIVEPYLFKILIDSIVGSENLSVGAALIGLLAVYAAAKFLQSAFWDIANLIRRIHLVRIESHAAHELMRNISSLDLSYFEDPKYYNTLSRATTSIWRITELFGICTFFIVEIVSLAVIVVALLAYDWRLVALVSLATVPSVFLAVKSSKVFWSAFSDTSPISRHAHYYKRLMTETPEAIKEIKSFGLQEHFLRKFRKLFGAFLRRQDKAAAYQLRWYLVIGLLEAFLSIVAAWLVVESYIQGRITIGELTFLWALLFQFASHARWSVRLTGDINTNALFLTPMVEAMNYQSRLSESTRPKNFPSEIQKGIEFRNVTFYYPGAKRPSLKNLNLFIRPHETVALVGENGSGKSTLIKLLCRFYDVTEGAILIDGVNIKEYSLQSLYENVGVIFQDFMKYEALIEENIGFGQLSEKRGSKVREAARKSGAAAFIKEFDKQYKTPLGKKLTEEGIELSVGQWQKMALARAFFRDSQILILDEPTAAVDARAEYQLFQRFKHLTKNRTTFLISHRFSTVRMADRIVVMHNGRIVEQGSHKDLLHKNRTYAKLFKLQARGYA